MKKAGIFFVVLLLVSVLVGCKTKQSIVENVRNVHDTAYIKQDSIVYRYVTLNGIDEETTATWVSKDTVHNVDTVYKYRKRTYKAESSENTTAQKVASMMKQSKDTTATKKTTGSVAKNTGTRSKHSVLSDIWFMLCGYIIGYIVGTILYPDDKFIKWVKKVINWVKMGKRTQL